MKKCTETKPGKGPYHSYCGLRGYDWECHAAYEKKYGSLRQQANRETDQQHIMKEIKEIIESMY